MVSALPYATSGPQARETARLELTRLRLAIKVGRTSLLRDVSGAYWTALAGTVGMPPERVLDCCHDMTARVPDAMASVVAEERKAGLLSQPQLGVATKLLDAVSRHSGHCRSALAGRPVGKQRTRRSG